MENRTEIFTKFIKENPIFENTESHHRRLADWQFDTKHRAAVDAGKVTYEEALNASRDAALRMLPIQSEKPQDVEGVTDRDATIAAMAVGRGQPIPTPAGHTEAPTGVVAQICARNAGFGNKED